MGTLTRAVLEPLRAAVVVGSTPSAEKNTRAPMNTLCPDTATVARLRASGLIPPVRSTAPCQVVRRRLGSH